AVRVVGPGVDVLTNALAVVAPPDRAASVLSHQPLASPPPSASVLPMLPMLPTGPLEALVAGLLLIVIGTLAHDAVRRRVMRGTVERGAGHEPASAVREHF